MSKLGKIPQTKEDIAFFIIAVILIALILVSVSHLLDFIPSALGPIPLFALIVPVPKKDEEEPGERALEWQNVIKPRAAYLILFLCFSLVVSSCEPDKPYANIQREAAMKRAEQIRTGEIPTPPRAKAYQYNTPNQ